MKARVPEERLPALRASLGPPERVEAHEDTYHAHPARDFAATDEALRLSRRGGRADLTYKGPRLDAATKARREIVVPLASADEAGALLEALGFAAVRTVRKTREVWRRAGFEVCLDTLPGLGAFVELERQLADDAPREAAQREAMALLRGWGIVEMERRSYLELVLERERAR